MFCEGKKNLSVRRKKNSKCEEGEEKCKCRISGVRKKNERKVPRKKIKVFLVEKEKKIKIFVVKEKLKLGENIQVK